MGVLDKIQSMLVMPELDHPINEEACKAYKDGNYHKIAKEWTGKYAK